MILPTQPDSTWFFVTMLTIALLGFGLSVFLNYKSDKYQILRNHEKLIFVPLLIVTVIIMGTMLISSIDDNAYKKQMKEIIETTDCKNLPNIAHEKTYFKSDVIDEIVIRCLINNDNKELVAFVKESRG